MIKKKNPTPSALSMHLHAGVQRSFILLLLLLLFHHLFTFEKSAKYYPRGHPRQLRPSPQNSEAQTG